MKFSIKTKILLFIVFPLTLFLGGYLFYASLKLEEDILNDYIDKNSLLIDSYAERINQTLKTLMKLVETGSESIVRLDGEISEEDAKDLLTQLVNDEKLIFGAVLAFAPNKYPGKELYAPYVFYQGDSLAFFDIAERRDYTKPDAEWYYIPAASLQPYWSKPYFAPVLNNKPLITYSYPVIINNELLAILEVDISLELLDEFLHHSMPTQKGRFILLDKDGIFISHPEDNKIIQHSLLTDSTAIVSQIEREELFEELCQNCSGFKELTHIHTNDKILSFYAPISNANWYLVIYSVREELVSLITDLFQTSFITIVFFFILIVTIVIVVVNNLLNPIKDIKIFAAKITSGNYSELIEVNSSDELGELSRDLNKMSKTLKEREDDLIKINEELEQRVKDRTEELKTAKDNLDFALKSAEMGTWKYFIKTNKIIGDENTKKLYGVEKEFDDSVSEWMKYIHHEDVEHLNRVMKDTIDNKKEIYNAQFRIVKPGANVSYIMSTGRFTYDENGKPIEAYGVVWDISKIKIAEEKLNIALNEAKQLSIAVEQSPVLITITDPDANIIYVNPEYLRVTGYSQEDVLGKKHILLRTGVISEDLFSRYKNIIKSGRTLRGEFQSKKKDGSSFWMKITVTGIMDDNNKVSNIVFIEDDISIKKRAEFELKEKNDFIAEKNKYITDSIVYAKKIQDSILPEDKYLQSLIPNYYLIYKPKDVVSGDFYWLTRINNKLLVAVVDCTGHGVPGSLMSMIGNTLLNEIVVLQNITDTADILNKLNSRLLEELNKSSNSKTKDGMDVSLVSIDLVSKKLQFSGAYRPLLYSDGTELFEIKGDRKSIGGDSKSNLKFSSKEIDINESTRIYLFSDGIIDQNNTENEKFGSRRLKKLIAEFLKENVHIQGEKINSHFLKHQNNEVQRDDVTFLAIEMNNLFINEERKEEFLFKDSFTYDFVLKIGDSIENKFSESLNRNSYKQLFFTAMELAQNIGHYSIIKPDADKTKSNGIGELKIESDDSYIFITSTNAINNSTKPQLIEKLNYYNSLDTENIKKFLKEKIRSASDVESKGGGIGFLEIIKRTKNPINFTFKEIDKKSSFIKIEIKIKKGDVDG